MANDSFNFKLINFPECGTCLCLITPSRIPYFFHLDRLDVNPVTKKITTGFIYVDNLNLTILELLDRIKKDLEKDSTVYNADNISSWDLSLEDPTLYVPVFKGSIPYVICLPSTKEDE